MLTFLFISGNNTELYLPVARSWFIYDKPRTNQQATANVFDVSRYLCFQLTCNTSIRFNNWP